MDQWPSQELLESIHAFPCCYTFKVIGTPDDHFIGRVVSAVRMYLPPDAEPAFSSRSTASGRHVCVTIEPHMESAAVVIEVYQQLHALEGVVMLL